MLDRIVARVVGTSIVDAALVGPPGYGRTTSITGVHLFQPSIFLATVGMMSSICIDSIDYIAHVLICQ